MQTCNPPLAAVLCAVAVATSAAYPVTAEAATNQLRIGVRKLVVNGAPTAPPTLLGVRLAASGLPDATVGVPYSANLQPHLSVTGDSAYTGGGVTWSVVANTLPAGLYLTADGYIGGTPTSAGTGAIQVRATYKGVKGEQTYQVVSLAVSVSLAAATLPEAQVGKAYSVNLQQYLLVTGDAAYAGGGVTWGVVGSSLPAGLYLTADGYLGGTPTELGSGAIQVRATYKGVRGEQTYQVVTLALAVSLAGSAMPEAIVGKAYSASLHPLLSVTGDAAYTGGGVSWSVAGGTLPAGLALSPEGRIEGTPTAAGSGSIQVRATYKGVNGEQTYQVVSLALTVSLGSATLPEALVGKAYSVNLQPYLSVTGDAAYTGGGVTWSVVGSTLPAGMYLTADGYVGGTPTAAGTGTVQVRATYKGVKGEQAYQVVSLALTVSLASATLPEAQVGRAYSANLQGYLSVTGDAAYTGGGVTWSVVSSSLPAGMYLTADGYIGGTPTEARSGAIQVRATYKGAKGEQTYQVVTLALAVSLSAATLPTAVVGQAYSTPLHTYLAVTGDAAYTGTGVTWSVTGGALPAGLTLTSDGRITGTPTTSGSGAVQVRAAYKGVNGEQTYQIVSLALTVTLTPSGLPDAAVGVPYSVNLQPFLSVTGDSAYVGGEVTWSIVGSSLPSGLYLTADGYIGGAPTAAGTGAIQVRATYKGVKGEQTYQVVSLALTVTLAASTLPEAIQGAPYSVNLLPLLSVTGDAAYTGGGVSWALLASSLPPGLYLTTDGYIGGTPTAAGSGTIQVRATYKGVKGEQTYQVVTLALSVKLEASTLPAALIGQAYSTNLQAFLSVTGDAAYTGGGVSWSQVGGTLPAGLSLTADGHIEGTPTEAGTSSVQVRAAYKGARGEQTYQVVSASLTVSMASATLPSATKGQAYNYDFKSLVSSNDTSFSVGATSFTASGLPAGLSLSSTGVLSGAPTVKNEAGASFQVVASYKGANGQRVYSIVVNGIGLKVTHISAGPAHTCAVTTAGAVKCWGVNMSGQLGNGTTDSSMLPVSVSGLATGVSTVYTGMDHTCALTTAGSVKCWGQNNSGQLGNNSTGDSGYPVQVSGLTSGVSQLSAGGTSNCVVTTAGAARCWGANGSGQLGNNSTSNSSVPVSVEGMQSGVSSIFAGSGSHACAVISGGGVKCWGSNGAGQLGNNSTVGSLLPVYASGLGSGVATLALGDEHTCAVTSSGGVKCWGANWSGQLGDSSGTSRKVPVDVAGLTSGVSRVSAGMSHTCAVTSSGGAKCWGDNTFGQLGNNTLDESRMPVNVSGLSTGVTNISSGGGHTCALTGSGDAMCWGGNGQGQLGNNTTVDSLVPVDVINP